MTIRSLLRITSLPVVFAGLAFSAYAQTQAPADKPAAAQDKAAVESAYSKADTNADGRLSKEEAAALPAIGAKFEELDKNKDGALSVEEFSAGHMAGS